MCVDLLSLYFVQNINCVIPLFVSQETLTGFKWMGNKSHELMRAGHEVLFAYEEAIGFMFGTTVLDKDGISAAAAAAELCSWLYSEGRTLSSLLEEIYTK